MEVETARSIWGDITYYPQERHEEDLVGDEDYYPLLVKEFGKRILRGSAVGWKSGRQYEQCFRNYLEGKEIKHAVEIGTWRGVSTSLLSHYAEKVSTVDIKYYDIAPHVWIWAGAMSKIKYYIVDGDKEKQKLLDKLDFDFAFIDGEHSYRGVNLDFDLVKKCGQVLFHDYARNCPGVMKFIDELDNVEKNDPFAYWSAK